MKDEALRRVGTTIRNKWRLERLLGAGGMAAVYVGVHRIGRRDALKILHPLAAQSSEICTRFEREAQAANRFRHPGAVEIRDIDVAEDGAPFLVMELLEGESLADRERRLGGIPIADVLRFADQVLDTLGAAHAQGIIHRDIKPGNLFVLGGEAGGSQPPSVPGERIKVLDFGLARIRQDKGLQGELTRMGIVLGTTPYMPPEQAKGRDIDARADLFAVGATMFRLIAGVYVHEATSDFDLLMKMGREPAPPLAQRAPHAPPWVCLVVDRALAYERDQRYPDAITMREDILAVLRGEPPPYASRRAPTVDPNAATVPDQLSPASPAAAVGPDKTTVRIPSGDSISVELSSVSVDFSSVSVELSAVEPVEAAPPSDEAVTAEWADAPTAKKEPIPAERREAPQESYAPALRPRPARR